jgi:protein-tyrosine phosphatase
MEEIIYKILDGVFLGNFKTSTSKTTLGNYNISHILCVGHEMENLIKKDFTHMKLNVADTDDEDILAEFQSAYEFIEEGREKGGVLVHCYGGISRSPTIIIAYLIQKLKIPFEQAINMLKEIKSDINPNEGFIEKLRIFEKTQIKTAEYLYKCSICRKSLFDDSSIDYKHEFTPKKNFAHKRYKKSFVTTNECSSYFLENASFVDFTDEIGGKISCPYPNV